MRVSMRRYGAEWWRPVRFKSMKEVISHINQIYFVMNTLLYNYTWSLSIPIKVNKEVLSHIHYLGYILAAS